MEEYQVNAVNKRSEDNINWKRVTMIGEKRNSAKLEFKAELSPSKKLSFIYSNESSLKLMKNAFLFHVKSSFHS